MSSGEVRLSSGEVRRSSGEVRLSTGGARLPTGEVSGTHFSSANAERAHKRQIKEGSLTPGHRESYITLHKA